ncbi:MAG: hypothetical protein JW829_02140 [Pirellulales bacterium]|nr:hypothetical protein [Pirellulales bacterium]
MGALSGICQQHVSTITLGEADQGLADAGKAIEAAFDAHDARALSSLWDKHAVHCSKSTGIELSGRQTISDAYTKLFAEDPGCTLSVRIQSKKLDTETTALVIGIAQVDHPRGLPTLSQFEARLTRIGAKWLLTRVDETDLFLDAATALGPLQWLVGRWVAEDPDGSAVNEFRFVDEGAFLLRNYWRESKDGPSIQGTQVIGWDSEQSCIRTWVFDSTGSFGEGYWQREGTNRWLNKLALKLSDGRRASLTQVLERVGEDQIKLQLVAGEIDGAAQPNGPVATLARKADQPSKPVSNRNATKGELP